MIKQHFLVSSAVFLFFEIVSRLFSYPKGTLGNLEGTLGTENCIFKVWHG